MCKLLIGFRNQIYSVICWGVLYVAFLNQWSFKEPADDKGMVRTAGL